MKKAVFLDRDGVINEAFVKDGLPFSPRSIEEFKILPEQLEDNINDNTIYQPV